MLLKVQLESGLFFIYGKLKKIIFAKRRDSKFKIKEKKVI
jgi:hypothetical protein